MPSSSSLRPADDADGLLRLQTLHDTEQWKIQHSGEETLQLLQKFDCHRDEEGVNLLH